MPHYQPCLLVCCLTIGHAYWCGASSSTMPVGVVPHYRPCLLAWYLTICHAFWSIATAINILLEECRRKNSGYKSGATCAEAPLYQTCLIIRCHSQICLLVQCNYYQICMLGSWIHLRVFVKCCSIKQGIWSVTNPSDIPRGRMPLAQGCETCRVPSLMPSWIYHILNVFYSITVMLQGLWL